MRISLQGLRFAEVLLAEVEAKIRGSVGQKADGRFQKSFPTSGATLLQKFETGQMGITFTH
jgi:hypothetical protein